MKDHLFETMARIRPEDRLEVARRLVEDMDDTGDLYQIYKLIKGKIEPPPVEEVTDLYEVSARLTERFDELCNLPLTVGVDTNANILHVYGDFSDDPLILARVRDITEFEGFEVEVHDTTGPITTV